MSSQDEQEINSDEYDSEDEDEEIGRKAFHNFYLNND